MSDDTAIQSKSEEIEMLLPWFVTGRLERADAERVEAYLACHPEMSRQLDLIREEMAETVGANETIAAPRTLAVERTLGLKARQGPKKGCDQRSQLLPCRSRHPLSSAMRRFS
jgi:anti-sigma factor RsiW